MTIPARDRNIISLVNQFGQLSSRHLQTLLFNDVTSSTPGERALKRLVESDYLARVERRLIGGSHGGSGQYVYVLGRLGWKMCDREGRYYKPVAPDYHTLAIADVYVRLVQAERAGSIKIINVVTEPDCWLTVQGVELRPDLMVELVRPGTGSQLAAFIEVDMGTERAGRITEKLTRYLDAYSKATRQDMDSFRRIIFLCDEERRVKQIDWLIGKLAQDQQKYFRSLLLETFPQAM